MFSRLGRFTSATLVIFASATVLASQRYEEIARRVEFLAATAYGAYAYQSQQATVEDMVIDVAHQAGRILADEGEFQINLTPDQMFFDDHYGWGTTGLDGAMFLFGSHDPRNDGNGNEIDRARDLEQGYVYLQELAAMGVAFGFTDSSSSYCGISFMGLLIIDVESGAVWEVVLTDSGPC